MFIVFFFSSRRRHTRYWRDWSSDVCSSDLMLDIGVAGVRTPRYTYVEHEGGEKELYDLKEDPYQIENIHETADASLLNALRSRLDALKECAGTECLEAESRKGRSGALNEARQLPERSVGTDARGNPYWLVARRKRGGLEVM